MSLPNEPIGRRETYLAAIAGQKVQLPAYPINREEAYLDEIAKNGGKVYEIKGAYDTEVELETAHPEGNAGDAYLVGDPTHVYVWLTESEEWDDAGEFTAIAGQPGLGIKSVDINASNHLIVTYDDDTTEDAGELPSGSEIDDTTPALNKVYSSEKVENELDSKLDASYATETTGGSNLVVLAKSYKGKKPTGTAGTAYEPVNSYGWNTTNLFTCIGSEKIKFNRATGTTSISAYYYDSKGLFLFSSSSPTEDTDGNYYFSKPDDRIQYVCIVLYSVDGSRLDNLVIKRYQEWSGKQLVFDDLSFSNKNMQRLKISNVLLGKKWVVAGDSFTEGSTQTVPKTISDEGRYKGFKAVYPFLIANRTGMEVISFFKGSRTLAKAEGDSGGNTLIDYYQYTPTDADYFTIYLGINDYTNADISLGTISDSATNTFYGAFNTILTWLITNRPTLKIGIIVSNDMSDEWRQATIAVAEKYGIPYIDVNGDAHTPCMNGSKNPNVADAVKLLRNAAFRSTVDNFHPNAAAHAYEATFIEKFLYSL